MTAADQAQTDGPHPPAAGPAPAGHCCAAVTARAENAAGAIGQQGMTLLLEEGHLARKAGDHTDDTDVATVMRAPAAQVSDAAIITQSWQEAECRGAAMSLSELLYQVPAPPAIRAAAFRALAAMPDVTKLGQASGDVVLRISFPPPPANKFPSGKVPAGYDEIKLIIDASALTVHAISDYTGTTTILAARWTNTLPTVIPASQLPHSPPTAQG